MKYYAENEAQPENFSSIFHAMWWEVASLTTVGYGDVYPITPIGKIMASFIAIIGIGFIALLTDIISSGFIDELHNERDENNVENILVSIEHLAELKEKGIISEDECREKKQIFLDKI